MAADKQAARKPAQVFVFGSDLAGRHQGEDGLTALRRYGATYGRAVGLQGHSYAIPVRDERGALLPLAAIRPYVDAFVRFASTHRELAFNVSRVGCGRGAYRDEQMAELFAGAPANCRLPRSWERQLKR
jgi:hypothetical protein